MEEPNDGRVFTAIRIRYDGVDASHHQIDLHQLGQSLQGAARLIAVSSHIALREEYISRTPAMAVRVLAEPPRAHCFDVNAVIYWSMAALPIVKAAAPKAVEAIVTYFIKTFAKPSEASKALDVAGQAVEALRQVSMKTIESGDKHAANLRDVLMIAAQDQRPALRNFSAPIGASASTATIGDPQTAYPIDVAARQLIDAEPKVTYGLTQPFTVFISELDTQTGHGKVAIKGAEEGKRFPCVIGDPVVKEARSAYSSALDAQRWLTVSAKPHLNINGDIERLTILDTVNN
ncbi:hypothetical protein [Reyranella massiliensis]|uniref:DUF7946 domain-containing protein n=1 Tax=Reyranella massiliensis TaxID=445220 RepID=UPI0011D21FD0|nr:hypothetical protein [Reyranella massiliensis]